MKFTALLFLTALSILSCSKSDNSNSGTTPTPTPPVVNNGPIGGTYTFTGLTTRTYDTTSGTGILTMNEYLTTSTNHQGTLTITATNIASKGLMYSFTTTGTQKEMNTATGATVTTTRSPISGNSGSATSTFNSNYTIDVTAGELTVVDAQYLFNSGFISQPSNKKHSYTLNGNTLKVITNTYNPSNRSRVVNEATFTK